MAVRGGSGAVGARPAVLAGDAWPAASALDARRCLEASLLSTLALPGGLAMIEALDGRLREAVTAAAESGHAHQRAAAFAVVGAAATHRHFPAAPDEPWILQAPFSTLEQKTRLVAEARSTVKDALAAFTADSNAPDAAEARALLGRAVAVSLAVHFLPSGAQTAFDGDGDGSASAMLMLIDGGGFRWGARFDAVLRAKRRPSDGAPSRDLQTDDPPDIRTADYDFAAPRALATLESAAATWSEGGLFDSCRGRSLPGALRRRLWRTSVSDAEGTQARRCARDLRAATAKLGVEAPFYLHSPVTNLVDQLVKRAFCASWKSTVLARHITRPEARPSVDEVETAAKRALNELYALAAQNANVSLNGRAAAVAVALSTVFAPEPDSAAELLVLLYTALTQLVRAPSGREDGFGGELAAKALTFVRLEDATLGSHLDAVLSAKDAAGSAADAVRRGGVLSPFADDFLAGLLPLDALLFVWDTALMDGWFQSLARALADVLVILGKQCLAAKIAQQLREVLLGARGVVRTKDLREAYARRRAARGPKTDEAKL